MQVTTKSRNHIAVSTSYNYDKHNVEPFNFRPTCITAINFKPHGHMVMPRSWLYTNITGS
jgi:hypothetical protein